MKAAGVEAVGQYDDWLSAAQRPKLQLRGCRNGIRYRAATAGRNDFAGVLQLHAFEAAAQLVERVRQVADETCARGGCREESPITRRMVFSRN